jgi:hypothetical protein
MRELPYSLPVQIILPGEVVRTLLDLMRRVLEATANISLVDGLGGPRLKLQLGQGECCGQDE